MRTVKKNDEVTISYDGLLATGELFDSAGEAGPLNFQLGTGAVLPAFEQAVLGMSVNETKSITVAAAEAFGLKNEELIMTIPRQTLAGKDLGPGMLLSMDLEKDGDRHKVPATVLAVDQDTVTVDFNHPLAGQDITYRITLLSLDTQATGCDCSSGRSGGCS